MTRISIITPSYNSGIFIENAILSVLNQDYDNWEHIIIDGGSTDITINILKKIISKKARVYKNGVERDFGEANGQMGEIYKFLKANAGMKRANRFLDYPHCSAMLSSR